MTSYISRLIFSAILLTTFILSPAYARKEPFNVLLLNSYHAGYQWTDSLTKSVLTTLANAPEDIAVTTEYMDTKRIANTSYMERLRSLYTLKFANTKFDLIISSDDNALFFLKNFRDSLFPGVPIVFCGVNNFQPSSIRGIKKITGVNEATDPTSTISAILKLQPDLKKLYIVSDKTITGRKLERSIQDVEHMFMDKLTFIYTEDLLRSELEQTLRSLASDTAVLFTIFVRDKSGAILPVEDPARFVPEASAVPVYTIYDFSMGDGMVGGMLTSGVAQGEAAAELALRIIRGESVDSIPVIQRSPNRYIFDYNAMKRFGLALENLPFGSTVLNKPHSKYDQYKNELIVIACVFVLLVSIIILLVINNQRRTVAEKKLRKLSSELEEHVAARTIELSEANRQLAVELQERTAAEKALELTEDALRTILNSVHDAILIHEADGAVRDVNERMLSMYGITRQELSTLSISEDLSADENQKEHLGEIWQTVLNGQSAFFEWKARRPSDGVEFYVDVALSKISLAGRDMILATVRDISKRKNQEEELRLLALAMEQASEAILITDRDMHVRFINPAFYQITGFTDDEVVGAHSQTFTKAIKDKHVEQDISLTLSKGLVWAGHFDLQHHSGQTLHIEGSIGPVRSDTGELVSYVGVFRNVSERLTLERRLRKAQKLESIGQLVSGIAKELTPSVKELSDNMLFLNESLADVTVILRRYNELSVAANNIPDLQHAVASVEKAAAAADLPKITRQVPATLGDMATHVHKVEKIIDALNDIAPGHDQKRTSTSINKVVNDVLLIASKKLDEHAEITTHLAAGIPLIYCIKGEIHQAVLNILLNATEAIATHIPGEKGAISISTSHTPEAVQIAIRDNGGGIPEAVQRKVFDPFFTTKNEDAGTGQGLALAHHSIVTNHNGSLTFETTVGTGTTFYITLPITSKETTDDNLL